MSLFNKDQVKMLGEKLSSTHVSSRKQSGISLSYLEGYHVIDEANRIFGFDGWSTQVVDVVKEVHEDITIGASKKKGHYIGVVVKVRVTVGGVISREDLGFGSGRSTSFVDAQELAYKEAVTDALKRALRTFGNQFGNALYDKEQKNVTDNKPVKAKKKTMETVKEPVSGTDYKALIEALATEEEAINFRSTYKDEIKAQSNSKEIVDYFNQKRKELS